MNESDDTHLPLTGNHSRRFLFEGADIRGEAVRLDTAFQDIATTHQYAPGVSRLLGEFLVAAVLLRSTLKFEGKLVLQARSDGQLPFIMAECNSAGDIRGIARGAEQATSDHFDQLLGNGQLAITVDPRGGQRYQGIVPLAGSSLGQSLDAYFEQSEQLKTRVWLAADGERAGGLLLQQLPEQVTRDPLARRQQWEHASTLADTVQPVELLDLPAEELLYRLYHEESVRLFGPSAVAFRCSCSRERTLAALSALDRTDLEDLLTEQGSVTMDCEFCNQQYRYARQDLSAILGEDPPPILH